MHVQTIDRTMYHIGCIATGIDIFYYIFQAYEYWMYLLYEKIVYSIMNPVYSKSR